MIFSSECYNSMLPIRLSFNIVTRHLNNRIVISCTIIQNVDKKMYKKLTYNYTSNVLLFILFNKIVSIIKYIYFYLIK